MRKSEITPLYVGHAVTGRVTDMYVSPTGSPH
jgi:hypothetical protein